MSESGCVARCTFSICNNDLLHCYTWTEQASARTQHTEFTSLFNAYWLNALVRIFHKTSNDCCAQVFYFMILPRVCQEVQNNDGGRKHRIPSERCNFLR